MNEKELQVAATRYNRITSLKQEYINKMRELLLVNASVKQGHDYEVEIIIKEATYNSYAQKVFIQLDAGVVQQSLLNNVNALRRALVELGGEVPEVKR